MQETQISSEEAGYLELASYSRKYYSIARNSLLFVFQYCKFAVLSLFSVVALTSTSFLITSSFLSKPTLISVANFDIVYRHNELMTVKSLPFVKADGQQAKIKKTHQIEIRNVWQSERKK